MIERHGKAGENWHPDWLGHSGANTPLVMMALIRLSDNAGACTDTRETIAKIARCSLETVHRCIKQLKDAGHVTCHQMQRGSLGEFGRTRYELNLEDQNVRRHFDEFRPRHFFDGSTPILDDERGQEMTTGAHFAGAQVRSPRQNLTSRPYKDSRAGERASESIIYHILPTDYWNEDEGLSEQIAEVLSVCGVGTEGVDTQRLIDSLEYHLPRAIEAGFDFEKDIVPCIKYHTHNPRPPGRALNRFGVTFNEDIPEWRNRRLRRKAQRSSKSTSRARPEDRFAEKGFREGGKSDTFDRAVAFLGAKGSEQWRRTRILSLTRMIGVFEEGVTAHLHDLRIQLPLHQRDLTGDDLIEALRPVYEEWQNELSELNSDLSR